MMGEMRMMWSRWWPGNRQQTSGMKVMMKERSRNLSAVGAGLRTVGALPGIGRHGGVPSTCPREPDSRDEWDS